MEYLVLERASLPSNVEICTICAPKFSAPKPEQFFLIYLMDNESGQKTVLR